jgi:hypothetical protein
MFSIVKRNRRKIGSKKIKKNFLSRLWTKWTNGQFHAAGPLFWRMSIRGSLSVGLTVGGPASVSQTATRSRAVPLRGQVHRTLSCKQRWRFCSRPSRPSRPWIAATLLSKTPSKRWSAASLAPACASHSERVLLILLNIIIQEAGGIAEVLQQMALWEQQAATAERNLQASFSRAASLGFG